MSDLISRQDAVYALTEANLKSRMDSVKVGQENRSAIRIIMELPSAKRKHGEWKHTITYYPYCSECGWMPEENEMGGVLFDYCPNCGADMRGEEDEIQGKK